MVNQHYGIYYFAGYPLVHGVVPLLYPNGDRRLVPKAGASFQKPFTASISPLIH
jgi:hypothetical protein